VPVPSRLLRLGAETRMLGPAPWLMGIVNATSDSFSDAGRYDDLSSRVTLARELAAAGAHVLDVGGESASPATPRRTERDEIAAVVPLVEAIRAELPQVLVSIDTYKPAVADAALAAGAQIVNDISGLADPALAELCATRGAAYVLMHNRGRVKQRLLDPRRYTDVTADIEAFFAERLELAGRHGLHREQVILDPGPDFSKTPPQTIALLRGIDRLHRFERPLLLPVSRKDFIGALSGRSPRRRLAGTLAALDHGVAHGAHIFRLHDVAAARRFLARRAELTGAPLPEGPPPAPVAQP
jgi:dihydropteroate synthase